MEEMVADVSEDYIGIVIGDLFIFPYSADLDSQD